jgi:hypothetical protein
VSKKTHKKLISGLYILSMKANNTEEIKNANFECIQTDETTDISCVSQFVLLLRYVKRDGPVERFHSFVPVQNLTAESFAFV